MLTRFIKEFTNLFAEIYIIISNFTKLEILLSIPAK